MQWNITLNEEEGTVQYDTPLGDQVRPARFTADKVYFIGVTLNRTDLTMERPQEDMEGNVVFTERGRCRVVKPAAGRAF